MITSSASFSDFASSRRRVTKLRPQPSTSRREGGGRERATGGLRLEVVHRERDEMIETERCILTNTQRLPLVASWPAYTYAVKSDRILLSAGKGKRGNYLA